MVQMSVNIVCKYADMQVGKGLELNGSQLVKLPGSAIVNFPPYCGFPRLSHQFPVEVVVVLIVAVVGVAVVVVWVDVIVDVVTTVVDVVVGVTLVVALDVVVLEQDASIIEITTKEHKVKKPSLFFKFALHFHQRLNGPREVVKKI
jgi:hypothetical protein